MEKNYGIRMVCARKNCVCEPVYFNNIHAEMVPGKIADFSLKNKISAEAADY